MRIVVATGGAADTPGMPNQPWPLPARGYDPDPRPSRGSWLFKLATVLLLALLAFPFLPESVRVMLPDGLKMRLPRVELMRPRGNRGPGLYAGGDSTRADKSDRNESAINAAGLSLDAVALEPPESSPAPKPKLTPAHENVSPPRRARPAVRHVVRPPSDEEVEPDNVTYVPDYAVSMVPTRTRTEIRLSSPPASETPVPEPVTRPAQAAENASHPDAAPVDAADDDKEWPLLCGQVVDASGNPVGGARVELEAPQLTVSTDAKGRFCVACPPGNRTVRIDAPGRGRATTVVALKGSLFEMRIELKPEP
jgi:hypothetical protein